MVSLRDQYHLTTNQHSGVALRDHPLVDTRSKELLSVAHTQFCAGLKRGDAPAFSVIIPARDAFDLLPFSISAIARQSYLRRASGDLVQVIIITDDGGSLKQDYANRFTEGRLGAALTELRRAGAAVTITRDNDTTRGRGGARNLGIGMAVHPILLFLDDSVVIAEDFLLDHAYRHYHARSKIALLGFKTEVNVEDFIITTLQPKKNALATPDWKVSKKLKKKSGDIPFEFNGVKYGIGDTVRYMDITDHLDGLSGGTILGNRHLATFFQTNIVSVRAEAVKDAGCFPEIHSWGMEDTALGVGLVATGCTLVPCPSATAYSLGNRSDDERDKQWKPAQLTASRPLYEQHISQTTEEAGKRGRMPAAPPSVSRVFLSDRMRYVGSYSDNVHALRGPYEARLFGRLKWLQDLAERLGREYTQRGILVNIATICTPLDEVRVAYKRQWDAWYSGGVLQSGSPPSNPEATGPALDRFEARGCRIDCIVHNPDDVEYTSEAVKRALGVDDVAVSVCAEVAGAVLLRAMRPENSGQHVNEHVLVRVVSSAHVADIAALDFAAQLQSDAPDNSSPASEVLSEYRRRQGVIRIMPFESLKREPLSAETLASYIERAPSQLEAFSNNVAEGFRREVSPLWLQHMLYGLRLASVSLIREVHDLALSGVSHTIAYIHAQTDKTKPVAFRNATDLVSKCLIFSNEQIIGMTYPLLPATRGWMDAIWAGKRA